MKKGLACHRTVVLDDLGLEFALVGRVSAHFDGHVRIDDVLLVIFHFGEVLSADHAEDQDLLHAKYHGPWQLISIQLGPHHSMGPINLSSAVPISQPEAISQPPDWNRELESRIGIENWNRELESRMGLPATLEQEIRIPAPEDFRFQDVAAVAVGHEFSRVDGSIPVFRLIVESHCQAFTRIMTSSAPSTAHKSYPSDNRRSRTGWDRSCWNPCALLWDKCGSSAGGSSASN